MIENNYAALGWGLKLYIDGMRRFLRERLIARYPNHWWDDGVLNHLSDVQRSNIKRDVERNPTKDKLDFIDAPHLVPIISREFNGAFAGVFSDFRTIQSLLQLVGDARNDHAHPPTGDFPRDKVSHTLYMIEQILTAAKLPEAREIRRMRESILSCRETTGSRAGAV